MGSTENYLMIQAFRAVRKNLTERVELTKKINFFQLRSRTYVSVIFPIRYSRVQKGCSVCKVVEIDSIYGLMDDKSVW